MQYSVKNEVKSCTKTMEETNESYRFLQILLFY